MEFNPFVVARNLNQLLYAEADSLQHDWHFLFLQFKIHAIGEWLIKVVDEAQIDN
jgi:hypothetical protein